MSRGGEAKTDAPAADDANATDGGGVDEAAAVRVRGIYATALTARLLEAGREIVQASPPIRRRVDADLPHAPADAAVTTTDDRQGVGVSGTTAGVEAVADAVDGLAEDTLGWGDPTPLGAVVLATVGSARGSGSVLDLGEREGWLPDRAVDGPVAEGEARLVQVVDPRPPWGSGRSVLTTDVRVPGEVVTLVRGADATVVGTPPGADEGEFARLGDLLEASAPDGWGIRWERAAVEADLEALDDALGGAAARAEAIDEALAGHDAVSGGASPADAGGVEAASDAEEPSPAVVARPFATAWRWFGRATRFALDAERASVTHTLAGHHRIKAGAASASDAVDFAERLGASVESFPTAAVLDQFGPAEGDTLAIHHGKPDGRVLTLGRGEVVEVDPGDGEVTVRRELTSAGTYDGLGVEREPGDTATTTFVEGRRWYPTVYRSADGDLRGTYVNVCTPVEVFPDAARYVDLHVDVLRYRDGTVEVVDEDELAAAVDAGDVPAPLAGTARRVADQLAAGLGG
ncbi:MAG: DUF402 domain-containing protein [Halobacteriaceae archaeon]